MRLAISARTHDPILERTITVARELVAGVPQALIPLAARLIPAAVSPEEVEREVGIPVVNTQAVAIRVCGYDGSSKTIHSQKAYPWAPGLSAEAGSFARVSAVEEAQLR